MKIPNNRQVFDCANCTFWLDENGILCCMAKGNLSTIETIRESAAAATELTKGSRPCILLDVTEAQPLDKATRAFALSETKNYKAMALISNSLVGSMVANIFLSLTSSSHPTKLFTNEEDAVEWLKQYL